MGRETFKKRQKELARRQKQQEKAARRLERRGEKGKAEANLQEKSPRTAESVPQSGPKNT
jgi:hypothetical protein